MKVATWKKNHHTPGRGVAIINNCELNPPQSSPTMSRSSLVTQTGREVLRVAYRDRYQTQV